MKKRDSFYKKLNLTLHNHSEKSHHLSGHNLRFRSVRDIFIRMRRTRHRSRGGRGGGGGSSPLYKLSSYVLPQEVMVIEVFWSEIDKYLFRELRDRVNILISFWLQKRHPRKRVHDWI